MPLITYLGGIGMLESTSLFVKDEQGNEMEMEILFTFDDEERNKKYVVFKNPKEDDEEVFASAYDDAGNLLPIETQEEWDMVEEVIGAFQDEESEA